MAVLELELSGRPQVRQPLFSIRVIDPPKPKLRARTVFAGKRTYTPNQTLDAAHRVRQAFIEKYGNPAEGGFQPHRGPVYLRFTAWLKMPGDIPRKYRETALPITKPDLPNMVMLLADALSGYAYADDNRITDGRERKRYAGTYGGPGYPCWEIEIFEADPELD